MRPWSLPASGVVETVTITEVAEIHEVDVHKQESARFGVSLGHSASSEGHGSYREQHDQSDISIISCYIRRAMTTTTTSTAHKSTVLRQSLTELSKQLFSETATSDLAEGRRSMSANNGKISPPRLLVPCLLSRPEVSTVMHVTS